MTRVNNFFLESDLDDVDSDPDYLPPNGSSRLTSSLSSVSTACTSNNFSDGELLSTYCLFHNKHDGGSESVGRKSSSSGRLSQSITTIVTIQ